ncbi:IrmA family protein [Castellaniella sp.]|uniref:IrmA family protein n=1 Tax=Castellaniella sp. TaxID=1955812 RepID=UPI002AFEB5F6|nr:IrmA family protein [Castellaniella sp.]
MQQAFKTYLLALVCGVFAPGAQAVEFWHASTAWAGQGQCAAEFIFDSGGEEVLGLKVAMTAEDPQGNPVDAAVMTLPDFGLSTADRTVNAFWESEAICDDDLRLVVTMASAQVDGQTQNLLKNSGLTVRDFKPLPIRLAGAPAPAPAAAPNQAAALECAVTLDKSDADGLWKDLQADPNQYYQQCVQMTAEMAMQFGGVPQAEAVQMATESCKTEINEAQACMAQLGAQAVGCFCGADG